MNGCVPRQQGGHGLAEQGVDAAAAVAEGVEQRHARRTRVGAALKTLPIVWYGSKISVPSGLRGHAAAPRFSALFFQKPGVLPSAPATPKYVAGSSSVDGLVGPRLVGGDGGEVEVAAEDDWWVTTPTDVYSHVSPTSRSPSTSRSPPRNTGTKSSAEVVRRAVVVDDGGQPDGDVAGVGDEVGPHDRRARQVLVAEGVGVLERRRGQRVDGVDGLLDPDAGGGAEHVGRIVVEVRRAAVVDAADAGQVARAGRRRRPDGARVAPDLAELEDPVAVVAARPGRG